MKKNTPVVQGFFNSNSKVDTLYFTCDKTPGVLALAFFKPTDAQAQAANLGKKNKALNIVITVTREEAFAEDAAAPEEQPVVLSPLEQAQANKSNADNAVISAKTAMDEAQVSLDNAVEVQKNSTATGTEKAKITKAVTNATKALADAKATYDNAVVDAQTAADALAALQMSK